MFRIVMLVIVFLLVISMFKATSGDKEAMQVKKEFEVIARNIEEKLKEYIYLDEENKEIRIKLPDKEQFVEKGKEIEKEIKEILSDVEK